MVRKCPRIWKMFKRDLRDGVVLVSEGSGMCVAVILGFVCQEKRRRNMESSERKPPILYGSCRCSLNYNNLCVG